MHFFPIHLNQIYCIATSSHSSFFVSVAIFGPPTLSTYTTVSSLHVKVTLPLGPNGVSIGDIITSSKNGPYKTVIVYILKITHPEWAAQVSLHLTKQYTVNIHHIWYDRASKTHQKRRIGSSYCFSTSIHALNSVYIVIRIFAIIIN